jgi:hypothetical protein
MQRELQRPEIEAKPDWHGRNEVEAIKNPEKNGLLRYVIYDLISSLLHSRPFAVQKVLMSRRCGAASPYRGFEEVSRKMRDTASETLALPFEEVAYSFALITNHE